MYQMDCLKICFVLNYNSSLTNQILSKNETKSTFMLSLVCFSFILLVFPIVLHDVLLEVFKFEKKEYNNLIHLALYFLYWFQYSLNFFIYAARCQQYRRAYVYFIIEVCHLINSQGPIIYFIEGRSLSSLSRHKWRF